MGCSSSSSNTKNLVSSIKSFIDSDNSYSLSLLLKQEILINNSPKLPSSLQISHQTYQFDLLGYSLFTNKPNCFTTLLKTFKFSPLLLIKSFHSQNIDPANKLCEIAGLQILEKLMPAYIEAFQAGIFEIQEKTPLHVACEQGHINILNYLLEIHKKMPTKLTDVNYLNNIGQNAAAVALLAGKYSCFKFIAQKSKSIVGLNDPILECLQRISTNTGCEYQECVMYLVQNLGYRLSQQHLKIATDSNIFFKFLCDKYNEQTSDKDSACSVSTSFGSI